MSPESGSSEKQRYIELVQQKQAFIDAVRAELFRSPDLSNEEKQLRLHDALSSLNEIIDQPWDSLYVRAQCKKLVQARDRLQVLANAMVGERSAASNQRIVGDDERLVYISLFQYNGDKLSAWQQHLRGLSKNMQGRPIYANEQEVQQLIRSKTEASREAYVEVVIKKKDVLTLSGQPLPVDRFGVPLMMIRDAAIVEENIMRFVHLNHHYRYADGVLQSIDEPH